MRKTRKYPKQRFQNDFQLVYCIFAHSWIVKTGILLLIFCHVSAVNAGGLKSHPIKGRIDRVGILDDAYHTVVTMCVLTAALSQAETEPTSRIVMTLLPGVSFAAIAALLVICCIGGMIWVFVRPAG
mgnify:CR=1 FL=1